MPIKWELLELIDKNIPIGKKGLLDFNIKENYIKKLEFEKLIITK